ncbi:MAG: acyl-CoA desaturase [Planctomycetes bacterium]|nr:acyl-CoA desaturase [Planctomycetota bacterium]
MASTTLEAVPEVRTRGRIDWVTSIPFVGVHAACLLALYTGVGWTEVGLCLGLYFVRMFALTAGYHRYFAHKTFQTSRAFQFVLALLGTCALQKGVLWWSAHHRVHHANSDQEGDVHSPTREGFLWSHVGWILAHDYDATNLRMVPDFARYPELRCLNRWYHVPFVLLCVLLFFTGGLSWLVWGAFASTVLLWHATFCINSLAHVLGRRRFPTTDTSRNNWFLALLTGGEGWHNNHHHYPNSANQGFYWWEIDTTYYVLRLLAVFRIVWDVRKPPARILEEGRRGA